jgi:toxin ParE1/3/4
MLKLNYLPLAQKNLRNIISYIADKLKAPKAAIDLVDTLDNCISRLQQFPYSCKLYQAMEPLSRYRNKGIGKGDFSVPDRLEYTN